MPVKTVRKQAREIGKLNVPDELKGSFVTHKQSKDYNKNAFMVWYAEIIFKHHPINNQSFNL